MNILIVDDDPVCRRVLREIMAADPALQITDAPGAEEAWALLDNPSRFFDVVFLDIVMPQTNGLELLARIRQSLILRSLRVVMCTATTDRETVAKVIRLGARHYLVKPAVAAQVQAKLKQLQAEMAADAAAHHRHAAGLVA